MNLQQAISGVKALPEDMWVEVARGLRCVETEALVDLFTVLNLRDHADSLLAEHIQGDEPGDLHYIETGAKS